VIGWGREDTMADYTFDGKRLVKKSSGQKLAEIDKSTVRSYNCAVYGELDRKNIRDSHSKKVAEFDGKEVKDDKGKKVITIKDIQAIIEGDAGIEMAAMWYFFVRK
jgi:hypothetical protein